MNLLYKMYMEILNKYNVYYFPEQQKNKEKEYINNKIKTTIQKNIIAGMNVQFQAKKLLLLYDLFIDFLNVNNIEYCFVSKPTFIILNIITGNFVPRITHTQKLDNFFSTIDTTTIPQLVCIYEIGEAHTLINPNNLRPENLQYLRYCNSNDIILKEAFLNLKHNKDGALYKKMNQYYREYVLQEQIKN